MRVAVLAVAEREFSIAGPKAAGANPVDLISLVRLIREKAGGWDHWIVLYHGAGEFQPVTPQLQRVSRFLIELGATAVVVQHPHALGGCERYRHGFIVYGQGALVMDEEVYRTKTGFHEGFLLRLQLGPGKEAAAEWIPFRQSKPPPGAPLLPAEEAAAWHSRMEAFSRRLTDPETVDAEWRAFCDRHRHAAMSSLLGHGRLLRWLNQAGWVERFWIVERRMRGVRNMVLCETHRELLQTVFDSWWYPPGGKPA